MAIKKESRFTNQLVFKIFLSILGVLFSCLLWIGQTWIFSLAEETKNQNNKIQEIDKRITKIEVIIPEIRDSLKEIKKDVKKLIR